jgi:hypothetical protein
MTERQRYVDGGKGRNLGHEPANTKGESAISAAPLPPGEMLAEMVHGDVGRQTSPYVDVQDIVCVGLDT